MKIAVAIFVLLALPTAHGEVFYVEEVETFVSPDSSLSSLEKFLRSADRAIYVNAYTFTSEDIAGYLQEELEEGTRVYVIVEAVPVGGMEEQEKEILQSLSASGAEVYTFTSERLRFNHAKYAVVDNRSLMVASENLGDNGFPPSLKGNRGWGIMVRDRGVARNFADLFSSDLKHSSPFRGSSFNFFRGEREVDEGDFESRSYHGIFRLETAIAPRNAMEETLELIRSANKTLYVEEFYAYKYFGGRDGSVEESPNVFLEECLKAARRGVEVKILLDSTWYNVEREDPRSNYYTVRYLNRVAEEENLELEVRLASDSESIEKYHVKGVVVDGRAAMVGTMNWNFHSPTKNREVNLIIHGEPAEYYQEVFLQDWGLESGRAPVPYVIAGAALALILLMVRLRR